MEIERAKIENLETIMSLYSEGRKIMRSCGNTEQWPEGYPDRKSTEEKIRKNSIYLVRGDDGIVHGTFYMAKEQDPSYSVIVNGSWEHDDEYIVIHRVAQDGNLHGMLEFIISRAAALCPYIRIDTHRDNVIMRHLLARCGFRESGTVFLENGDERLAFERMFSR